MKKEQLNDARRSELSGNGDGVRDVHSADAGDSGELGGSTQQAAPVAAQSMSAPDWPECEEFYNLMQYYRHTPVTNPIEVHERYEDVKRWLREYASSSNAALFAEIERLKRLINAK